MASRPRRLAAFALCFGFARHMLDQVMRQALPDARSKGCPPW
jgi:hypothetical protein